MRLPGVGDTIATKYRLDHVIGRGGFATVFRATDVRIDRTVAVKVLTPGERGYPIATASRFKREARSLASLSDPHTIRMFDYGRTDDGVLFMVFELLGGLDLSKHLSMVRKMDEASTIHVVEQVLMSLREAHQVGILHRDLKPANIRIYEYMDDPLRVKLMDFGIVRLLDPEAAALTGTGLVVGTVRYMSPEQMQGLDLTPASDLFALGLLAYEMLTGDKRAASELLRSGEPIRVPASPATARLFEKMLHHDPTARFQSADQVLTALARLDQRDITAAEPGGQQEPHAELTVDVPTRVDTPSVPEPIYGPVTNADPDPAKARGVSREIIFGGGVGAFLIAGLVFIGTYDGEPPPPAAPTISRPAAVHELGPLLKGSPPEAAPSEPDVNDRPQEELAAVLPSGSGCGRPSDRAGELVSSSLLDGFNRVRWQTYVPKRYHHDHPHPLLVLFHADASNVSEALRSQNIQPFADAKNFMIIAPISDDIVAWRDSARTALVGQLITQTQERYCVDPTQIFAYGVGGGGGAVEAISCEPWVKAVATTSWRYNHESDVCPTRRRVPSLHLAPLKSRALPVDGGLTCIGYDRIISLEAHEALWRQRNGCGDERHMTFEHQGSKCFTWNCEVAFVSCRIDGGHTWKGFQRTLGVLGCDGPAADFPHLKTMWSFFQSTVSTTELAAPD